MQLGLLALAPIAMLATVLVYGRRHQRWSSDRRTVGPVEAERDKK